MNNDNDLEFYQIVVSKYLRDMFIELEDNDFFNYFDCINIFVDGNIKKICINFKHYEKKQD